jgi:hypothetical protein
MTKNFRKLVMIQENIKKIEDMGFQVTLEINAIFFQNEYGYVGMHKEKNIIYLECSFLNTYGISKAEIGYIREWLYSEENINEIYKYIINVLLPRVINLKGPYGINKNEYYEIIAKTMEKHGYKIFFKGEKRFVIPMLLKNYLTNDLSEISGNKNVNYIEFPLDDDCKVYFTIKEDSSHGLIFSFKDKLWFYPWYRFGSVYDEGVNCIIDMVEKFLENWKSLINAPTPIYNPEPPEGIQKLQLTVVSTN